jgi:hypothetical protein
MLRSGGFCNVKKAGENGSLAFYSTVFLSSKNNAATYVLSNVTMLMF